MQNVDMTEHTPKPPHRRRVWRRILISLFVAFLCVLIPTIWTDVEFRRSAIIGLTPAQVIDRCGDPSFASSRSDDHSRSGHTTPVWSGMSKSERSRLMAQDEFMFGYERWLGTRIRVAFNHGIVSDVKQSSK
jgi:hypothetical protein